MSCLNKRLIDLTVGELLFIFENNPIKKIKTVPDTVTKQPQIKKVTLKKISLLYGWGPSTIYRWIDSNYIPYHRVGGQYWFDLDQIDQWISEKKTRTKEEVIQDFNNGKIFYSRK